MRTALFHRSEHLPESKLSPPLSACIICGTSFADSAIAKLQRSPDIFLLRCPNCHACTGSRMPTDAALSDYYSKYFEPVSAKITHDSPARVARHIASFVRAPKKEMTITDFGGGGGSLAYAIAGILCERGCASAEITVIDYADSIPSRDPRITVRSARPGSPIPDSDVILASAVLEHLPQPLSSLKELLAGLKRTSGKDAQRGTDTSGILYIRTPAVAGFMKLARVFGQQLDFTYPAHLHDLGQGFWENVLTFVPDGADFEILHSAPSLVETDLRHHPWHTLAARLAKAPWRFFGRKYTLVGGWEIVFRRK
jgi:transcription elongation factor Elf1